MKVVPHFALYEVEGWFRLVLFHCTVTFPDTEYRQVPHVFLTVFKISRNSNIIFDIGPLKEGLSCKIRRSSPPIFVGICNTQLSTGNSKLDVSLFDNIATAYIRQLQKI